MASGELIHELHQWISLTAFLAPVTFPSWPESSCSGTNHPQGGCASTPLVSVLVLLHFLKPLYIQYEDSSPSHLYLHRLRYESTNRAAHSS